MHGNPHPDRGLGESAGPERMARRPAGAIDGKWQCRPGDIVPAIVSNAGKCGRLAELAGDSFSARMGGEDHSA